MNLNVSRITADSANYKMLDVLIEGADESDVLNHFNIDEIIRHFGEGELLSRIGEKRVVDYFGLESQ